MTADKVTLRLNAVATYRVADAHKALSAADDAWQALYREAQLALRAVIGAGNSTSSWPTRTPWPSELEGMVRQRVAALGLEVISVGIRDVILPGDMKDLMNNITSHGVKPSENTGNPAFSRLFLTSAARMKTTENPRK